MPTHKAETTWTDDKDGNGKLPTESGTVEGTFTFPIRLEDELGPNSGGLVGTTRSDCFSVQLTAFLEGEGYTPTSLHTAVDMRLDPADGGGFEISHIDLTPDADVSGIDEETFDSLVQRARENCPVSKTLAGPELALTTTLTWGRVPPTVLFL